MKGQGSDSVAGALMANADVRVLPVTPDMEQQARACVQRLVPEEEDRRMIYDAPFGRGRAAQRKPGPDDPRPAQADPAYSQMPPEDIGAWRAQVCEWGRADGRWPDANSKRPLEPALVDAYRLAHPERDRPRTGPGGPPMMPTAHIGDGQAARDVRARMRQFGRANGTPVSKRGPVGPELAAAYYAAHPEEAL